jgi:hypothetical protein
VTSSKQLSPMDYEHEDKELPPSYEEILRWMDYGWILTASF